MCVSVCVCVCVCARARMCVLLLLLFLLSLLLRFYFCSLKVILDDGKRGEGGKVMLMHVCSKMGVYCLITYTVHIKGLNNDNNK